MWIVLMSAMTSSSSAGRKVRHVIAPNRGWFKVDWMELLERRDLLFLLVRRDLVSKYRQTVLGPAWHVLQPLALAVVFTMIFGRVAGIPTDGAPRILFYLCSLFAWHCFAQNLQATSATFSANASLFGKVYFPRLVVPLAAVLSNLVALGIQFGVFLSFYLVHKLFQVGSGYGMTLGALLLPLLVMQTAAFALGVGLWISSLTAKYRDLRHAMSFIMLIWMLLTPVIYPLSQVPGRYGQLLLLNPVATMVESFRYVLLGVGTVNGTAVASSIAITIVVLWTGLLFFQRTERTVVDTL
jgi:lipopolysaccharide transport system permease protein